MAAPDAEQVAVAGEVEFEASKTILLEMNFQCLCTGRDTQAVQRGEITYGKVDCTAPKKAPRSMVAGSD